MSDDKPIVIGGGSFRELEKKHREIEKRIEGEGGRQAVVSVFPNGDRVNTVIDPGRRRARFEGQRRNGGRGGPRSR